MRRAWVPLAAVAAAAFAAAQDGKPLPPPEMIWEGRFATSVVCARCHENHAHSGAMRDARKRPVAPVDLWQSSMMANAARDPLWRAAVSVETAATPARKAEIEAKCMQCHAPMAAAEARLSKEAPVAMSLLEKRTPRTHLALDGVSCALCHQIQPDGLGTEASFTGGFVIRDTKEMFGPHKDPFASPMQGQSGYTPVHGAHVLKSALCATCHTVVTGTLDADGKPTGALFHEQSTYQEWSAGPQARSCQDCHVPARDADGAAIETMIARSITGRDDPDVKPRAPFGRHLFVGGNTLVPAMLRDHAKELGAGASREAFDATIAAARAMLSKETARLAIVDAARDGRKVTLRVRIETLTGHKFPTGAPMRRAWLRVVARDAKQRVVFASGGHDAEGHIVGADGKPLAFEEAGGPIEPSRERVAVASEAAVFESVMADGDGRPTFLFMRAAKYAKDSRLAPGTSAIAVAFESDGPVTVTATLLYQPVGPRFAAELFRWDTADVRAFRRLWEKASRAPETVAEATAAVR